MPLCKAQDAVKALLPLLSYLRPVLLEAPRDAYMMRTPSGERRVWHHLDACQPSALTSVSAPNAADDDGRLDGQ